MYSIVKTLMLPSFVYCTTVDTLWYISCPVRIPHLGASPLVGYRRWCSLPDKQVSANGVKEEGRIDLRGKQEFAPRACKEGNSYLQVG